ncbi:RCL1 [Cyberlindnera jadinii]|uniref:18S rRNA biogenesis protein n=1 Tax=Cyberlindnera jadinii (strain ATCC 18201 / CBS 1600 / BCRC 20928 / JCM 3617 / NBRC 0987 / NRRL Y-1542) TaxID=983966 RepID=A0A0H5C713_CYBJN|nr:18S rRNA biogenesis protein [Cyberlindnera jadinii NRRL Y-1542]ODV71180.1 18S rRNA biogenesis protein [Cyberlindnera jadinii NRRL Y-1542]CEP23901.1 RCL1 [Cyberlindnera jadinii]
MSSKPKFITFQGSRNLRHRFVLATLLGKPIKIEKIRSDDLNPGLRDYEVSFLRLLEAVTNGCRIEISYTGTSVIYYPGIITGGAITHNCNSEKSIGYYMEPMLFLAPFSKKKFQIVFRGITGLKGDTSIEGLRWGILPLMEKFGVREAAIHTVKRGCPPIGEGEVHLVVDTLLSQPLTMHALEIPKINAIRGVAFCARVSPSMANRMIDSARDVLRPVGCEVNITADVWRGENSGKSPGFGIVLVAETKKGWRYYSEEIGEAGEVPEDLGTKVAYELLEQVSHSGVVCKSQLAMALTYMVIGKEDIGRLVIKKDQIDEDLVWLLRDIKHVFGTEVFLKEDEDDTFIATVKGVGFVNTSKKIA